MGEPLHAQPFDAFDDKTSEQHLREAADREEIRELVSRYALGIARGHQVGDFFTDDGVFIQRVPGEPVQQFSGRAEFAPMYAMVADSMRPIPMIHNHIIDIDGDDARGQCSIELRMAADGKSLIGSGYYDDVYRRENGRWRFVKRDATIFHMCDMKEGWVK